jgi:amidase
MRITRENVCYSIGAGHAPIAEVGPGTTLVIETHDARGGKLRRAEDVVVTAPDYSENFPKTNPATGPITIRGAEPGDAIVVRIQKIELDAMGFTVVKPDFGLLRDMVPQQQARMIPVSEGRFHFGGALSFPTRPMVGLLATSPMGHARGTAFVGPYGGNMDCSRISVGAEVHLPVFNDGGPLFVGDLHASMGDGEVCGTGIEIGGIVTLDVDLVKRRHLRTPMVFTHDLIITMGFGHDYYTAAEQGVRTMVEYLTRRHALPPADVYALVSATGDLRVNQSCRSPIEISVRVEFPRHVAGASAPG